HVLLALINQEGGSVHPLLNQAGVDVNRIRNALSQALEQKPSLGEATGEVNVGHALNRVLNLTDKLAQRRGDQFIPSELFVLAAVDDKGAVGDILRNAGASKETIEQAIDKLRGGQTVEDPNAEDQRQALEKYTIDMTERAEQGKIDPVIGRDE